MSIDKRFVLVDRANLCDRCALITHDLTTGTTREILIVDDDVTIGTHMRRRGGMMDALLALGAPAIEFNLRVFLKDLKLFKADKWRDPMPPLPPRPRLPRPQLMGGRSFCARLPRGKCRRWRSLKEKRQAWGYA